MGIVASGAGNDTDTGFMPVLGKYRKIIAAGLAVAPRSRIGNSGDLRRVIGPQRLFGSGHLICGMTGTAQSLYAVAGSARRARPQTQFFYRVMRHVA